jgi:Tfp pilus assembly protein PilZ
MTQAQRRDKRYPYPLSVSLNWKRVTTQVTAKDVSFNGLFLPTPQEIALRQLVQVQADLPWDEFHLVAMAMVVHVAKSESATPEAEGIGLQFFALGKEEAAAWHTFVDRVRQVVAEADEEGWTARLRLPKKGAEKRAFGRFAAVLEVRTDSLGELVTLYTRDVSKGGMFLITDLDLDVGDLLQLEIVHPDTGRKFPVRSIVRRRVDQPDFRGIGVQFVELHGTRREEFWRFVSDHLVALDETDLVPVETTDGETLDEESVDVD